MEYSTLCKYKTVKDIKKPAGIGIYHYVADSSCCTKSYRNRLTHFGGQRGEIYFIFSYKHTHTTHKQILSFRVQVTNMDRIERLNAQNT